MAAKSSSSESGNIRLSKSLSYILRHGAAKEGFTILPGGFLKVSEILKSPRFQNVTELEIRNLVSSSDKQRFALKNDLDTGELLIRANQGHSIQVQDLDLKPITSATEFPEVIHGTYLKHWSQIQKLGLSRMKRNHIHFAAGKPGNTEVISGMRTSAQIHIFLDLQKALNDGLKFYLSENKVILSPGNEQGIIHTKYFAKVLNSVTGETLNF